MSKQRQSIGGQLDWRLLHRPSDPVLLAKEAQRLRDEGLTAQDISQVLRVSTAATKALLEMGREG